MDPMETYPPSCLSSLWKSISHWSISHLVYLVYLRSGYSLLFLSNILSQVQTSQTLQCSTQLQTAWNWGHTLLLFYLISYVYLNFILNSYLTEVSAHITKTSLRRHGGVVCPHLPRHTFFLCNFSTHRSLNHLVIYTYLCFQPPETYALLKEAGEPHLPYHFQLVFMWVFSSICS